MAIVRGFGRAVQTTHEDSTRSVAAIAAAYRGSATDTMVSGWGKMSAAHVDEIVDGCDVLAGALDVAAGYIVVQKAEAIAVLVGPEAAAKPLFAKVEDAMVGLDWSRSGAAPADPPGEIFLDAGALARHVGALQGYAATMRQHGATFGGRVAGLAF